AGRQEGARRLLFRSQYPEHSATGEPGAELVNVRRPAENFCSHQLHSLRIERLRNAEELVDQAQAPLDVAAAHPSVVLLQALAKKATVPQAAENFHALGQVAPLGDEQANALAPDLDNRQPSRLAHVAISFARKFGR